MFAELISEDIVGVVQKYGYDIKIEKRDNNYDLFLIYPDYCLNDPLRIMTFSDKYTEQEMLREPDVVREILEIIKRNENAYIIQI
jgi:hypothetical protein